MNATRTKTPRATLQLDHGSHREITRVFAWDQRDGTVLVEFEGGTGIGEVRLDDLEVVNPDKSYGSVRETIGRRTSNIYRSGC